MEGFYFAGSRVNPESVRTIPKDRFIQRFLPQHVFFPELPIDKREEELGLLWDMCQEPADIKEEIPESHKKASKKVKNDSKGIIPPLDADVSEQDGNNGGG